MKKKLIKYSLLEEGLFIKFFKIAKYLHISFISKNNQKINEYFPINQSVIKKHFKKSKLKIYVKMQHIPCG